MSHLSTTPYSSRFMIDRRPGPPPRSTPASPVCDSASGRDHRAPHVSAPRDPPACPRERSAGTPPGACCIRRLRAARRPATAKSPDGKPLTIIGIPSSARPARHDRTASLSLNVAVIISRPESNCQACIKPAWGLGFCGLDVGLTLRLRMSGARALFAPAPTAPRRPPRPRCPKCPARARRASVAGVREPRHRVRSGPQ